MRVALIMPRTRVWICRKYEAIIQSGWFVLIGCFGYWGHKCSEWFSFISLWLFWSGRKLEPCGDCCLNWRVIWAGELSFIWKGFVWVKQERQICWWQIHGRRRGRQVVLTPDTQIKRRFPWANQLQQPGAVQCSAVVFSSPGSFQWGFCKKEKKRKILARKILEKYKRKLAMKKLEKDSCGLHNNSPFLVLLRGIPTSANYAFPSLTNCTSDLSQPVLHAVGWQHSLTYSANHSWRHHNDALQSTLKLLTNGRKRGPLFTPPRMFIKTCRLLLLQSWVVPTSITIAVAIWICCLRTYLGQLWPALQSSGGVWQALTKSASLRRDALCTCGHFKNKRSQSWHFPQVSSLASDATFAVWFWHPAHG